MNYIALFLSATALSAAASAQTTATPAAKPATLTAKPATTATKSGPAASAAASADWYLKLPASIPRVRGIIKPDFALRYEDIKIGTGAEAVPNKMYHVNYTGYLAATGEKFDSNADRRMPKRDKDGKPVMGPDGKPVLDDPQPLTFPQGYGRLIPGFDQGFTGMKIGGKRRLFIPWQLAYGTRDIPGHPPEHPGIPPKSNLIFDVELVDITDMPTPPQRPQMPIRPQAPGKPGAPGAPGAAPGAAPAPGGAPPKPGVAGAPGAAPSTTAPTATTAPSAAPAKAAPATAPATTQPTTTPSQSTQPQKQ
ncbi:MAG TPA: FKBP-type peptidyl-prolyl cis-trans isomerase [Terracidiphilus sp.]|nr:FKBP-type peptidyl-prolyl cis-trans isomerase [Terracidiphilus sp.]